MNELISIIITSYNYENYIQETIASLKKQTYSNFEVIIIDDCSTDNSVEVIQSCIQNDNRFNLIVNDKNKGLPLSLKLAVQKCNGSWCAFCESDDYWHENHLFYLVENIKKFKDENVGIIVNKTEIIYDKTKIDDKLKEKLDIFKVALNNSINYLKYNASKPSNINYHQLRANSIATFSSVAVKTDILKLCNFEPTISRALDWWLWTQVTFKHNLLYIDNAITYWRIHTSSFTSRTTVSIEEIHKFKSKLKEIVKKIDKKYYVYSKVKRFIYAIKYDCDGNRYVRILGITKRIDS